MTGYVPLYRKIKEWEWYDEANTMRMFIHCLISANHKDNKWRGILVKKGSFITSIGNLAHELKLTKQNVRTALANLQKTNEITIKTTHHYTTINVVNWAKYEVTKDIANTPTNTPTNTPSNTRLTHDQHTPNTRLTTNNNEEHDNNEKKEKKKDKDIVGKPDLTSIVDFYNSLGFSKMTKLTPTRKKQLNAIIKSMGEDELKRIWIKAKKISFLHGSNDRGWKANFDWLVKESNLLKIDEDVYNNGGSNGKTKGRTKAEINTIPDDAF